MANIVYHITMNEILLLIFCCPVYVICGTVTPTTGDDSISGVKGKSIDLQWDINTGPDKIIGTVGIYIRGNKEISRFIPVNGDTPVSYQGDENLKNRLSVSYSEKGKKSGTVTLSIANLNFQDKHNFTCAVTFTNTDTLEDNIQSSQIHIINIHEVPHFCKTSLPTSFEMTERKLTLDICGNPMPSLTWKIGNQHSQVAGKLKYQFDHLYSYEITTLPNRRFCGENLTLEVRGFNESFIKKNILLTMTFKPEKIKDVNVKLMERCPVITITPEDTGRCKMSYEVSSADGTGVKIRTISLDLQNSFIFCETESLQKLTHIKIRSVYKGAAGQWSDPFSIQEPSKPNDKSKSSGPDVTIIAVIVVLAVLIILAAVVIVCALLKRKQKGNPGSIEMEDRNGALQNEYVPSADFSRRSNHVIDEQNTTLYSELGTGGGRIPGSNPAQQRVVPESNYASVKVDEKGYPMRSLDTIESNQIKHAGFGLMSKYPK